MPRYRCGIVGSGTEADPFRPAITDLPALQGVAWSARDERATVAPARDGTMLVTLDRAAPAAAHAAARAAALVVLEE